MSSPGHRVEPWAEARWLVGTLIACGRGAAGSHQEFGEMLFEGQTGLHSPGCRQVHSQVSVQGRKAVGEQARCRDRLVNTGSRQTQGQDW